MKPVIKAGEEVVCLNDPHIPKTIRVIRYRQILIVFIYICTLGMTIRSEESV